jgi:DNA mismatch endonuclease (patch repair protein)
MTDRISHEARSRNMARVRSRDTAPEMAVRRALFRDGFRFRLHVKRLPGCPDVVLPKFKVAVFVHGCFWHGHYCKAGRRPSSNREFWERKIEGNVNRDRAAQKELIEADWQVITIWACELNSGIRSLIQDLTIMSGRRLQH